MNNRFIISILSFCLIGFFSYSRVALAGSSTAALELEAQTALESGDYEQAAKIWQTVLANNPTSDHAAFQLGLSLHQQEDLMGAIAAYQQAIQLNPRNDKAHLNLGLLWVEVGFADQAIAAFETVLTLPEQTTAALSNHTLAHYDLAIVYKRLDQTEAAIVHVSKALEITPSFERAQVLLQQLQGQP